MDWRERINSDPSICHGKPCIKGTRIMVYIVLDCLAAGMTAKQILEEYPSLEADDVQAALEYAAALARNELVPV